jgi:hypothetical protein
LFNFVRVMGFNIKLPEGTTVLAPRFSIAIDLSQLYPGSLGQTQFKTSVVEPFFQLHRNICAHAVEVYACWDGLQPLQKNYQHQKRYKNSTYATLQYDHKQIVHEALLEYCNAKTIFIDSNFMGEGEIKCCKFSGWTVPVDCVYAIINDNDTYPLLLFQPKYVPTANYRQLDNLPEPKFIKKTYVVTTITEDLFKPTKYKIPIYKLHKIHMQHKSRRGLKIIDFFWEYINEYHDIDANARNTKPMQEIILLGLMIWFGNDYNTGIFTTCNDTLLYCLFHHAYDRANTYNLVPRTGKCVINLLAEIPKLVALGYSRRAHQQYSNKKPEMLLSAVHYYYYRLLWNFVYYHDHIIDVSINDYTFECGNSTLHFHGLSHNTPMVLPFIELGNIELGEFCVQNLTDTILTVK